MLVTFPNPSIVSFFYILIQIILTATLIGPRNLTAGLVHSLYRKLLGFD